MIVIRQKIFFDRTKEMDETLENIKGAKNTVVSKLKKVKNIITNPKKTVKSVKDNLGKVNSATIKNYLKGSGKKALKFIKNNPRDAAYMAAGYTIIPYIGGKIAEKKKGKKAGIATLAALPIGESLVAVDHLSRSKAGKTGAKALGQVIKGVASDIGKRVVKRKY